VLFCRDVDQAQGYYFLACLNMLIYGGLCLLVLQLHFRENVLHYRDYLPHYSSIGITFSLLVTACVMHLDKGVKAMTAHNPLLKAFLNQPRSATKTAHQPPKTVSVISRNEMISGPRPESGLSSPPSPPSQPEVIDLIATNAKGEIMACRQMTAPKNPPVSKNTVQLECTPLPPIR
jgi:hypothetical protein